MDESFPSQPDGQNTSNTTGQPEVLEKGGGLFGFFKWRKKGEKGVTRAGVAAGGVAAAVAGAVGVAGMATGPKDSGENQDTRQGGSHPTTQESTTTTEAPTTTTTPETTTSVPATVESTPGTTPSTSGNTSGVELAPNDNGQGQVINSDPEGRVGGTPIPVAPGTPAPEVVPGTREHQDPNPMNTTSPGGGIPDENGNYGAGTGA